MNIYKNARLTLARRLEMVQDVLERKLTLAATAWRTALACRPSASGSVAS